MSALTGIQKILIAVLAVLIMGAGYFFYQSYAGTSIGLVSVEPGFTCGTSTVTDIDGNVYNTLQIGQQCWMKQNMRVGTFVSTTTSQTDDGIIMKWCFDNTESKCTSNHPNYPDGGLYQWDEAMQYSTTEGARGICPVGWHIPTHDEFTTLERAVATSSTKYSDFPYDTTTTGYRGTYEGTALKPNGSSGFEGNLAGFSTAGGSFLSRFVSGYWWSSSEKGALSSWYRAWSTTNDQVYRESVLKTYGISVRCLKDTPTTGIGGTLDNNASLQNGLVGHWTFDGPDFTDKVYDTSGQGHHAYLTGGSTTTSKTRGVLGQGLIPNPTGVTSYGAKTASYAGLNDLTTKTVTAWVKQGALSATGVLVSKISTQPLYGWSLYENNRDLFFFADWSGTNGWWYASNVLMYNQWVFVTVTYDHSSTSNVPTFYVNGEAASLYTVTSPTGSIVSDASYPLMMGNDNVSVYPSRGTFDDVRIYNRILSADEIKRLYQLGATTKVAQTLSNPTLDNGLIGHWTFDGSDVDWSSTTAEIRDRSGNNYHGNATTSMTATSSPTKGVLGQALYFSSTSLNYITIPDSVALSGGAGKSVSIAAWVKLSTTSQQRVVVRKWLNGSDKDWELNYEGTGENNFRFWTENAGGNAYCHATGTTIVAGQWYHAAATFDGPTKTCRVYVNGTLGVEEVELYDMPDTAANVEIGGEGYQRNDGYNMDGSIDDVRVYNRTLSATEVKRLYDLGR
jgi:uncharacterized protein (TIGR02145 family)